MVASAYTYQTLLSLLSSDGTRGTMTFSSSDRNNKGASPAAHINFVAYPVFLNQLGFSNNPRCIILSLL